jgi:hypothetical protein
MMATPQVLGTTREKAALYVFRGNRVVSLDEKWIRLGYATELVEWAQQQGEKHIFVNVVGLYSGPRLLKFIRIKADTLYVVNDRAYVIDIDKLLSKDTDTFDLGAEQKHLLQQLIRTETPESERAWWHSASSVRESLE